MSSAVSTTKTEGQKPSNIKGSLSDLASAMGSASNSVKTNMATAKTKIKRNDPCPCGSGKKYKKCGLIDAPEHRGG